MTEKKNKGGRPVKFKTAEDMQVKIDLYFLAMRYNSILFSAGGDLEAAELTIADLDKDDQDIVRATDGSHPTVTGLALVLDLSRQGLNEYGKNDRFYDTVKKAKLRVEHALEQRLYAGSPVGSIFNLKNNFGWKDQTEVKSEVNTVSKIVIEDA